MFFEGICELCERLVFPAESHEWDEDGDKVAHTRCIEIEREIAAETQAEAREDYRRGF